MCWYETSSKICCSARAERESKVQNCDTAACRKETKHRQKEAAEKFNEGLEEMNNQSVMNTITQMKNI